MPQDVQVATGPLHQAVELLVPALLIGVLYSVFSFTWCCALIPFCRQTVISYTEKNTSGNDGSEDGTMLCNASTGDGGGAAYVEWTSWVFFPMDSNGDSEFAWGLQPWSGMGTVPGEALWDFWCVKENKWESQTLTKNRDHHLLDVESFNRHC